MELYYQNDDQIFDSPLLKDKALGVDDINEATQKLKLIKRFQGFISH